ncbi:hypothetical protein V5799_013575 [Amblyomma americanum]|uniref:Uncharacterized protein n=1 Tax=Amblyomma americanum TaxID=6943 RepID=A0AAQ4E5J4_AMBAM
MPVRRRRRRFARRTGPVQYSSMPPQRSYAQAIQEQAAAVGPQRRSSGPAIGTTTAATAAESRTSPSGAAIGTTTTAESSTSPSGPAIGTTTATTAAETSTSPSATTAEGTINNNGGDAVSVHGTRVGTSTGDALPTAASSPIAFYVDNAVLKVESEVTDMLEQQYLELLENLED